LRGYRKLFIGFCIGAALIVTGYTMTNGNYPQLADSLIWLGGVLILGNVGVHWAGVLGKKKGGGE